MAWVALDDAILDNPKIIAAGPHATLLYVAAIAWSNRNLTDGFIPAGKVATLVNWDGALSHIELASDVGDEVCTGRRIRGEECADRLLELRLWHEAEGGYVIHDYPEYQRLREEILAERAKSPIRQAQYRSRRQSHRASPVTSRVTSSAPNPNPNGSSSPDLLPRDSETPVARVKGGVGGKARKRRADRAAPLPQDFPFTEERRKFAEAGGVPDPALEFAQFKDHHRSRGSLMYDWEAAWKTWCRNAVKYATQRTARR